MERHILKVHNADISQVDGCNDYLGQALSSFYKFDNKKETIVNTESQTEPHIEQHPVVLSGKETGRLTLPPGTVILRYNMNGQLDYPVYANPHPG